MNQSVPAIALQLCSLVQPDGTLQISLESTPVPTPGPDEVLIQVQATPINPSDIGLLRGPADLSTVQVSGTIAGVILQQWINTDGVLADQMVVEHRVGYWDQQPTAAIAALDAWLFINIGAPLIGAGRGVPDLPEVLPSQRTV